MRSVSRLDRRAKATRAWTSFLLRCSVRCVHALEARVRLARSIAQCGRQSSARGPARASRGDGCAQAVQGPRVLVHVCLLSASRDEHGLDREASRLGATDPSLREAAAPGRARRATSHGALGRGRHPRANECRPCRRCRMRQSSVRPKNLRAHNAPRPQLEGLGPEVRPHSSVARDPKHEDGAGPRCACRRRKCPLVRVRENGSGPSLCSSQQTRARRRAHLSSRGSAPSRSRPLTAQCQYRNP